MSTFKIIKVVVLGALLRQRSGFMGNELVEELVFTSAHTTPGILGHFVVTDFLITPVLLGVSVCKRHT